MINTPIPVQSSVPHPTSAKVVVKTLSRSLGVVMGWQEVELPSRWVIGAGDMRKLTICVRDQPVNFMITVHQSLMTAKHGQGLCETGLKASEILLGKRYLDHTEQEKAQFTRTRLEEIMKSASALNKHTCGIKKKFRSLRTVIFEIHERLKLFTEKRERGSFAALLSRFSKDVRKCEGELQEVLKNLTEIEDTLNLITRWWDKVESDATYLQMNGESKLAPERNRILLKEIEDGFRTLQGYFADYVEKMSEYLDQISAKLNEDNQERLGELLEDSYSVVPSETTSG